MMGFLVSAVDLILAGRMTEGDDRIAIMDALGLGGYGSSLADGDPGEQIVDLGEQGVPRRAGRRER